MGAIILYIILHILLRNQMKNNSTNYKSLNMKPKPSDYTVIVKNLPDETNE